MALTRGRRQPASTEICHGLFTKDIKSMEDLMLHERGE
jgi:hypothetical protein